MTDKQFSIDGNLLSQNKVIVLKLKLKVNETTVYNNLTRFSVLELACCCSVPAAV